MVSLRKSNLRESDLYNVEPTDSVETTLAKAQTPAVVNQELNSMNNEMLADILLKASTQLTVSFYDTADIYIANKEKEDVTDTDAIRRAIHTISNYYNTLGVWRDDFNKTDNDKLARNAYYSMCEKAMMDYMGTLEYRVVDKSGEEVEIAMDFLECPNPQDSFDVLLKQALRDLVRYDAGVWVKSMNKGGHLTEIKAYLGTEMWKEIDRVPMAVAIPKDYIVSGATMYQGWWSHGYTMRYWQRSRTGVYIPFTPEEVCYFMLYPRTDGIYGTDFIKFLRHQLQYLIDSTRAAGKTFENGIVPSIVWEHPDIMTREQLMQRIRKVEVENKGSYKFGGIIHTVNQEKVTTLAQKLHDMEWLEGQKFVAQLIWAMWGFSASEFMGEGENRATAYVKRNITKSRLLYPLMRHIAHKINADILPYLKGYHAGWKFEFTREVDLDDEQKVAQTQAVKITSFNSLLSLGMKPSVALKVTGLQEELTDDEVDEMDETMSMQMGMGMEGEGGMTEGGMSGDLEQGRYRDGSEQYQTMNFEDYGQGAEDKKPRSGEEEEKQYSKAKVVRSGEDNRPDSDYNEEQLKMGIEVEKEHTKDEEIAKQIAKDHLDEDPVYYTKLKKMEKKAGEEEKGLPEDIGQHFQEHPEDREKWEAPPKEEKKSDGGVHIMFDVQRKQALKEQAKRRATEKPTADVPFGWEPQGDDAWKAKTEEKAYDPNEQKRIYHDEGQYHSGERDAYVRYNDEARGEHAGTKPLPTHSGEYRPRSIGQTEHDFKKGDVEYFQEGGIVKAKVYINYPSEAPPGRHVGRGKRGGYYYITNVREQHPTPMERPQKNVAAGRKKKKGGWGGGGKPSRAPSMKIPEPPDLGGKQVKVMGKNVGLVVSIRNDRLTSKKLNTPETEAFIKQVLKCAGGLNPAKVLSCVKSVGEKAGLQVIE